MKVIALVGPTASGKTALSLAVADLVGGEVISMDSRQAYRGMSVGTAAPGPAEMARVPHHGVGFLDPRTRYGAGRFADCASEWIARIRARDRVPVLAGGTGLFLKVLTDPMFAEPDLGGSRRERLERWTRRQPNELVSSWAERLDRGGGKFDRQRAGRTVELALLSGRPLSWWIRHGEPSREPVRALAFRIDLPPEDLRHRIRCRAESLLESGRWQREAEALLRAGVATTPAMDAVGYGEVFSLLRGEITAADALRRIEAATWRYARRQRTWFRGQLPDGTAVLDGTKPVDELARIVVRSWRKCHDNGLPAGKSV